MHLNKNNISGIIVSYNSRSDNIENIFKFLHDRGIYFIVSDNSDQRIISQKIKKKTEEYGGHYLPMNENIGIAAAQNLAIDLAWEKGYEAIMLLDDDSLPEPTMYDYLINFFNKSKEKNIVLGARTIDSNGFDISNAPLIDNEMSLCRELMSSGSLITKEVFKAVGPFDNTLFIDCVDFEWGWRAQKLGVKIIIVNNATLRHKLGEGKIFGVGISSPVRHYYQFRNVIRMIIGPHAPLTWKVAQVLKLNIKLMYILFIFQDKKVRMSYALKGVLHALAKKSGKFG